MSTASKAMLLFVAAALAGCANGSYTLKVWQSDFDITETFPHEVQLTGQIDGALTVASGHRIVWQIIDDEGHLVAEGPGVRNSEKNSVYKFTAHIPRPGLVAFRFAELDSDNQLVQEAKGQLDVQRMFPDVDLTCPAFVVNTTLDQFTCPAMPLTVQRSTGYLAVWSDVEDDLGRVDDHLIVRDGAGTLVAARPHGAPVSDFEFESGNIQHYAPGNWTFRWQPEAAKNGVEHFFFIRMVAFTGYAMPPFPEPKKPS